MTRPEEMNYIWFLDEDEVLRMHEYCSVSGCKNGRCYALDSTKCYPHSNGLDPELMDRLERIVEAAELNQEKV